MYGHYPPQIERTPLIWSGRYLWASWREERSFRTSLQESSLSIEYTSKTRKIFSCCLKTQPPFWLFPLIVPIWMPPAASFWKRTLKRDIHWTWRWQSYCTLPPLVVSHIRIWRLEGVDTTRFLLNTTPLPLMKRLPPSLLHHWTWRKRTKGE